MVKKQQNNFKYKHNGHLHLCIEIIVIFYYLSLFCLGLYVDF